MNYKKYPLPLYCVCMSIITFGMENTVNHKSSLLVSQKNNYGLSLCNSKKNTTPKKIIGVLSSSFYMPHEVFHLIKTFMKFSCWKDEIVALKEISPVKIGTAELWAIDLWRMPAEDRQCALNYHGRAVFTSDDYDTLRKIMPEQKKKELLINRLPLNHQLYRDWAGIPGGRCVLRFMIAPAIGLGVFGTVLGTAYFQGGSNLYYFLSVGGALGGGITLVGSIIACSCHKSHLRNNIEQIAFQDV